MEESKLGQQIKNTMDTLVEEVRMLKEQVIQMNIQSKTVGEWLKEEDIIKITGLSNSTLYKLRSENKVTSTSFGSKRKWYKLKDFQRILNKNEGR